jgi:hypothetical protein
MKFLAEDFNRLRHLACFKMVNYQPIFKNGINARLLGKLAQQAIIMFRRNVDQYFQGSRTINPLKLRQSLKYAYPGHQFLAGTKNIWLLSFCINPLPIAGQEALVLEVWLSLLEDFYLRIHPRCFASQQDRLSR